MTKSSTLIRSLSIGRVLCALVIGAAASTCVLAQSTQDPGEELAEYVPPANIASAHFTYQRNFLASKLQDAFNVAYQLNEIACGIRNINYTKIDDACLATRGVIFLTGTIATVSMDLIEDYAAGPQWAELKERVFASPIALKANAMFASAAALIPGRRPKEEE